MADLRGDTQLPETVTDKGALDFKEQKRGFYFLTPCVHTVCTAHNHGCHVSKDRLLLHIQLAGELRKNRNKQWR